MGGNEPVGKRKTSFDVSDPMAVAGGSIRPEIDTGYRRGGERNVYDQSEMQRVVDALRRIGIFELAAPPETIGRHGAINYVLPSEPATLSEDTGFSF